MSILEATLSYCRHTHHRILWLMMGLSVVMHVAVMMVINPSAPDNSRPILLTLAAMPPHPPTVKPPEPAPAPPLPKTPPKKKVMRPDPVPSPAATTPVEPVPATSPTPVTSTTSEPTPVSVPVEPPVAAASEEERRVMEDQYSKLLIQKISQFKAYPVIARRNGWQGVARVQIEALPGGKIASVSVVQSSGYSVLDQQALSMVQKALPLPPLPKSLEAHRLNILIPIPFRLE